MTDTPDARKKFHLGTLANAPAARYFRIQVNKPNALRAHSKRSADRFERIIEASAPHELFQHHISTRDPRLILGHSGRCIYCGATRNTPDGGERPTDEHIIPEGLGGNLILERASCQACAIAVNGFEGKLQRTLFYAPRRKLNIRGKRRHKDSLFEVTTSVNGKDVKIELPLDRHPTALLMPKMIQPRIMTTREPNTPGFSGISLHSLTPTEFLSHSSLNNFATPSIDLFRFCQLLAKIAYSYSCAPLTKNLLSGHDASHLVPLILKRPDHTEYDMSCYDRVGGISGEFSASNFLHEIGIAPVIVSGMTFYCVFIRLFANLGTPIYCVVIDYKI